MGWVVVAVMTVTLAKEESSSSTLHREGKARQEGSGVGESDVTKGKQCAARRGSRQRGRRGRRGG